MNRFTTGLPVALAFIALSGAAAAADEATATPASEAQATSTATPAATPDASANTSATPSATTPPPANRAVANSARAVATSARNNSDYEVRRMFCLNMSMQCFSIQQDLTANNPNGSLRRLDLHAPDIRRVVSESELHEPVKDEYEVLEEQEQVQVEATRPEVYVPGGLMSLPWAVMHPTQAWRIFLPVPSSSSSSTK